MQIPIRYTRDISQIVYNTKSRKIKQMSTRHFIMGMICTTHPDQGLCLKMRINHESMWNKHHTIHIKKTHLIKLIKMNPTHIRIITYIKSQQQHKNPRNQSYNHEILRENRKTHTFSWSLKLRKRWNRWIIEWNTMSLWECWTNKTMNSKKCSRENYKVLKTVLKAQNTRFSRLSWVANKPNTLETQILKNLFKYFENFV